MSHNYFNSSLKARGLAWSQPITEECLSGAPKWVLGPSPQKPNPSPALAPAALGLAAVPSEGWFTGTGSASAHLRHQHQKRILTLVRSSFLNPHNTTVGQRHKIKGVPPPFHSLSFPTHLRPSFNYVHKRNATSERTGLKRNRCKREGLESIN